MRSSGKFFGYCDDKGSQATTQFNLGGGGITLCPQAFKPTDLNGAKRDTRLGATEPECLDLPLRRGIPKKRQEILEVYCTAMTLYHELFHLVLGSKASPDYAEGGKLLGCKKSAGKGRLLVRYQLILAQTTLHGCSRMHSQPTPS